jgi:hypothetical protein
MPNIKAGLVSAALLLASAACQTPAVTTTQVQNDVAAAEAALTGAEELATVYAKLPRCQPGATGLAVVCSDPAILTRILATDQKAYEAVKAARANPGLVSLAWTAIGELQALIPNPPPAPAGRAPAPPPARTS